ncbi:hypothetical protein AAG570_000091 [Ranatra chinensis]|uniref:TLC domain-containing protein n=1 Tax=Ranatra chinensis TaxID=642074 RepID=A0ABD0ZJD1_9HEMI
MEPADFLDTHNFGYLITFVSFCLFYLNNWYLLTALTPKSASTAKYQQWKWRNIANSLVHSSITGCGACLCFWQSPGMREDLIYKFSHSSHFLLSLSIGYFFYDLIDMSLYDRSSKKFELLLHHFLVILCFGLAMVQKLYMGYALMALLLEVNSIFLHLRQLMIIQQWSKMSPLFRINNSFNLGTFVVFRILTLGWMTRWLLQHRSDLTPLAFNLAGLCEYLVAFFLL